ncbi:MAG: TetR/AcrR family transcriptional regulator [Desulfobacterales bacterium]|jgi:AcrR family transcriptional regulator|nr:TetR/AcrR family transcriptional regulator [Desulfobacterales bacterium]
MNHSSATSHSEKHCKDAFEKISPEKQKKIMEAAVAEFAGKGFSEANINVIAKNAGISIGSMYNYFESKENLFLTVVDYGYKELESALATVDLGKGDIFDKFEMLIRIAQKFSKQHPELNQIYLDLASQGLFHLSQKLSRQVESITAFFYRSLMDEAKRQGLIADDLDEYVTSFCLDNLLLLLQFSYSSEYYKERMKIFAGADALENDEKIVRGIMRFVRGALSPAKN